MNATRNIRYGVGILAAAVAALSLVAGAAAASPPTVTTQGASSVTASSAKLNGTVDPNGEATNYYFEFGTTTSYGTRTAVGNAGAGTRGGGASATITGLAGSTTYHYRIVASNTTGTTLGADQTFTTQGPPVVITGTAQGVGTTTATLTGSVDPRGHTTTWHFDWGTTSAYGSKTPNQNMTGSFGAAGVGAAISGLTPATTYHYRLVASNSGGTADGSDATFTTPAAVTIAQAAQRVVAGGYVTLSGTVTGAGAGVTVTILGEQFGATSYTQVATALTGSNGTWSYNARPLIQTAYEASANGGTTAPMTVGVQPSILLIRITGQRFSGHVTAATTFAGKQVKFQRWSAGKWVNVRQTRLNAASTAIFPSTLLPHGKSQIRVALSVNQAGPGYLGGLSRTLTYLRP
jgi:hypothetical protein